MTSMIIGTAILVVFQALQEEPQRAPITKEVPEVAKEF
jgi:hypothetical protein